MTVSPGSSPAPPAQQPPFPSRAFHSRFRSPWSSSLHFLSKLRRPATRLSPACEIFFAWMTLIHELLAADEAVQSGIWPPNDRIGATTAVHEVALAVARGVHGVVAGAAVEGIPARFAVYGVVSATAVDRALFGPVVTGAAAKRVVAGATVEAVVTEPTEDEIVTSRALEAVAAPEALQHVGLARAPERVATRCAAVSCREGRPGG